MSVFFTSDPHLGHRNILKYRACFSSIEEHDEAFFSQLYALNKRDVVKILGDVVIEKCRPEVYEYYAERLASARCRVQVMLGNHDDLALLKAAGIEMLRPLISYKNMWLSHCPIHPQEFRGRTLNIHGHLHGEVVPDARYVNVNLDVNNYRFVSLDEIKEAICRNEEEAI